MIAIVYRYISPHPAFYAFESRGLVVKTEDL